MKWNANQQKDRLAITIYFSSELEQELYDVLTTEAKAKRISLAALIYNILEDKYYGWLYRDEEMHYDQRRPKS